MVTFKYKGNRTKFVRTDGGRVIAFGSGSVHELDENDKRSKELVKKIRLTSDLLSVSADLISPENTWAKANKQLKKK
jgi:hypothetical protein